MTNALLESRPILRARDRGQMLVKHYPDRVLTLYLDASGPAARCWYVLGVDGGEVKYVECPFDNWRHPSPEDIVMVRRVLMCLALSELGDAKRGGVLLLNLVSANPVRFLETVADLWDFALLTCGRELLPEMVETVRAAAAQHRMKTEGVVSKRVMALAGPWRFVATDVGMAPHETRASYSVVSPEGRCILGQIEVESTHLAEAHAILVALRTHVIEGGERCIVFSDSAPATQMVDAIVRGRGASAPAEVLADAEVQLNGVRAFSARYRLGSDFQLVHVLGHARFPLNTAADRVARIARMRELEGAFDAGASAIPVGFDGEAAQALDAVLASSLSEWNRVVAVQAAVAGGAVFK